MLETTEVAGLPVEWGVRGDREGWPWPLGSSESNRSLFAFVVPWHFPTLTSALASLHSHSIGGHLVPTASGSLGMAGLKFREGTGPAVAGPP